MKAGLSLAIISLFAFGAISCSESQVVEEELSEVTFFTPGFCATYEDGMDITTKTQLLNNDIVWAEGDVVGIYPDQGGQVYFNLGSAAGTNFAEFDGGGWAFKKTSRYISYYPFIPETYLDRNNVPVSYLGQAQIGLMSNNSTSPTSLGKYDFMCTQYTEAENGSLNFRYERAGLYLYFNISGIDGTFKQLTITSSDKDFVTKGHVDLEAENFEIIPEETSKTMTVKLNDITIRSSEPAYIYMALAPTNLNGKTITVSLIDTQNKQYDCEKSITREYVRATKYGLGCNSWTYVGINGNLEDTSEEDWNI